MLEVGGWKFLVRGLKFEVEFEGASLLPWSMRTLILNVDGTTFETRT